MTRRSQATPPARAVLQVPPERRKAPQPRLQQEARWALALELSQSQRAQSPSQLQTSMGLNATAMNFSSTHRNARPDAKVGINPAPSQEAGLCAYPIE
jgi:hypothetical protein